MCDKPLSERERDEADYEELAVTEAMRQAGGRIIEDLYDVMDGRDIAEDIFREMVAERRGRNKV